MAPRVHGVFLLQSRRGSTGAHRRAILFTKARAVGHRLPRKPSSPRTALPSGLDCTDTGQKAGSPSQICELSVLAREQAEGAPRTGWGQEGVDWVCLRGAGAEGRRRKGHINKDQNQAAVLHPPQSEQEAQHSGQADQTLLCETSQSF